MGSPPTPVHHASSQAQLPRSRLAAEACQTPAAPAVVPTRTAGTSLPGTTPPAACNPPGGAGRDGLRWPPSRRPSARVVLCRPVQPAAARNQLCHSSNHLALIAADWAYVGFPGKLAARERGQLEELHHPEDGADAGPVVGLPLDDVLAATDPGH